MLNRIKRGLLFLFLSAAILVKKANAQASLIGTFTYMGQLIRDLLYGISAVFGPILTRELFIGPYGYVYGRLVLGIIISIFIYISAVHIFEQRNVRDAKKFAGIITFVVTLTSVIGIPDNVIYLFFATPMFIAIIAVALALSLLRGEGKLVWALKGMVYLVIVAMFGWFGNVIGYNEISGILVGLGSLIFFIAAIYYLGKAVLSGAEEVITSVAPYAGAGGGLLGGGLKKGGKLLGRKLSSVAKKGKRGMEKAWNWYKKRAMERLKKDTQDMQTIEEIRDLIQGLITYKEKGKTIEPSYLKDIVASIQGKLQAILKTEHSTRTISAADLREIYENISGELRWGLAVVEQPNLRNNRQCRTEIDNINRLRRDISQSEIRINELLVALGNIRIEDIERRIEALIASLNNGLYENALTLCNELIEIKNNLVNLTGGLNMGVDELRRHADEIRASLARISEIIPEQEQEQQVAARANGVERLNQLIREFVVSKENLQAPAGLKNAYALFIHYLKNRRIGNNEREITVNLGIDIDTMAREFNRIARH